VIITLTPDDEDLKLYLWILILLGEKVCWNTAFRPFTVFLEMVTEENFLPVPSKKWRLENAFNDESRTSHFCHDPKNWQLCSDIKQCRAVQTIDI
jgi:hypothetical protein